MLLTTSGSLCVRISNFSHMVLLPSELVGLTNHIAGCGLPRTHSRSGTNLRSIRRVRAGTDLHETLVLSASNVSERRPLSYERYHTLIIIVEILLSFQ